MIEVYKKEYLKALEYCQKNVSTIRTGRANANILNGVMVDVYGAPTPLEHVATIAVPEARLITISPWDKANMKGVEDAINKAGLNLNPVNDGQMIRLNIPNLTEESRKELVKLLGQKLEDAKVQMRKIREKVREVVTDLEKNSEISQDDKYSHFEKIDKMTSDYTGQVEALGKKKEEEIMTI